jgi:hypothetical protein
VGLEQLGHAGAVSHVHADMGVVGVIGLARERLNLTTERKEA